MSPSAGRFLTRDPIGYGGGSANIYSYVMSDPMNWTDSIGLSPDDGTKNKPNIFNCVVVQRRISVSLPSGLGATPVPIMPFVFASIGVDVDGLLTIQNCDIKCSCSPAKCQYQSVAAGIRFEVKITITGGGDYKFDYHGYGVSGWWGIRGEYRTGGSLSGFAENSPCDEKCDLGCLSVCTNIGSRIRLAGGAMMKIQAATWFSIDLGAQVYVETSMNMNMCMNLCSGDFTVDSPVFSRPSLWIEGCSGICIRKQLL